MNTTRTCPECGKPVAPNGLRGLCPECMMQVGLAAQTVEAGPGGTQVVPPQAKPPPTLAEVAALFPQLEILECLGCGGMGAVYRARQPRLDRLVALKILTCDREDATREARFAERFEREARALAKLSHPNIVAMYEFGQVEDLPYFIMEHVEGLNLRQLERAGKLSSREALQIIPQICEALQFAHDEGIVHRDIKPENILLDRKGRVKIADFGIAKILGGTPLIASDAEKLATKPGEGLTQDQVLGTPHYMAPEQVEHPQTVDHRADIYSLGVVFYEMLTGELPLGKFQAPSRKVQIDVRLDEIVLHTLEKEPERRYQHASEVRTDVENVAGTPPPPEGVATEKMPRSRAGLGLTGVLVCTRNGARAICWSGVVIEWLIIGALAGLGFFVVGQPTGLRFGILESCMVMLFPAAVWVGAWMLLGWSAPMDKLVCLEAPTGGTCTDADRQPRNARSCRIPGTNLALVESRNGHRLVNWHGVVVAWVLFMLVGALGLGLIAVVANQMGFDIKPETFQTAGVVLAFVAAVVLSVAVRRTLLLPDDESESPGPSAKAASQTLDPERVNNARRLVRWPATGLGAIGLSVYVVAGCFLGLGYWPASWPVALGLCGLLVLNYVIILGSSRMRQLQDYRMAVLAAIVCLVFSLPGLPLAVFPIWALMVLYRPDVRAAFEGVARKGASAPAATPAHTSSTSVPRLGVTWATVAGVTAAVMVLLVFLLVIVVPSLQRAPSVVSAFGPEIEVSLSSLGSQVGDHFLDLDTGRIVRPPGPYSGWSRERKHEWLRQQGIDLMLMGSAFQSWSLLTPVDNATKLTKVSARAWQQGLDSEDGGRPPESAEAIQFVTQDVELLQVRLDGRPTLPDHTFAFQTANGARGVVKVSGLNLGAGDEIVGMKLRFKKSQAAAESTRNELSPAVMPRPEAVVFGPVTEVLLNDMDDLRGGEALDLDSGKLLDLPKDIEKLPETEQSQWLKNHSADVMLDSVNGRWGLLTSTDSEMKLAPLPNEKWELATERDLSQALAAEPSGLEMKKRRSWTVYVFPTNSQPPLTFAFHTVSGARGVLQVTGFEGEPNSARLRYKVLQPATTVRASPREVVAEWLRRVKAGTREAWDLTTRSSDVGWGPSFTGLWEYDRIRPLHQLGSEEQAMVLSNPFNDNSGRRRVFYAALRKRDGQWLVDRQECVSPNDARSLMRGFAVSPGIKFDVLAAELVGEWGAACDSTISLAADGTGAQLRVGPGGPDPGAKPESFQWEVSGSTLRRQFADRDEKLEILWMDDQGLQFRSPNESEWDAWWRTPQGDRPAPELPTIKQWKNSKPLTGDQP